MPFSIPIVILPALVGLAGGLIIGAERQARGHEAGLHTNALVALGAAIFVAGAGLSGADAAARMAAQVATGIGFLGAGLIWRDGFSVRGINTAATIWCSAATGIVAGFHHLASSVALALLVAAANGVLHFTDRWTGKRTEEPKS